MTFLADGVRNLRKAFTGTPEVVEAISERRTNFNIRLGGSSNQRIQAAFERAQAATYGGMYATQPAVRTVVDKVAESIAQLGLKLYRRVDESEREPEPDHPAAVLMRYPNEQVPADQFVFDLNCDFLVYNNAYALKVRNGAQRQLLRVPPHMVTLLGGTFIVAGYRIYRTDGTYFERPVEDVIHWRRYNPDDPRMGLSPLETLRLTLQEDAVTQAASVELAKSGLKGGHIERPLESPPWSDDARGRFLESWHNATASSPRGTPLLEEGMTYVNDVISPKDAELLKGREFTLATVCRLYGVPLGIFADHVGEEDRRTFYADVLAPRSKGLACQLDHSILGVEYDETDLYYEFSMDEKLRGDIESRLPNLVSASGAPIMLRDEARSILNLPPLPDDIGQEPITPLNVLVGDNPKPAPNVMGPQDPNKPPQDGSYRENGQPDEAPKALEVGQKQLEVSTVPKLLAMKGRQRRHIDEATALVRRLYRRQREALPGKATFDSERWNREFAADLLAFLTGAMEREAGLEVGRLGGDDFDMRQVAHFLKAMAVGIAEGLNRATQRDLEGGMTAVEALDRAQGERSVVAGASIGTRITTFARQEAAQQAPFTERRMQTWVANTDRHAELNGVSVPLGSDWGGIEPGSEPNCSCSVYVT